MKFKKIRERPKFWSFIIDRSLLQIYKSQIVQIHSQNSLNPYEIYPQQ